MLRASSQLSFLSAAALAGLLLAAAPAGAGQPPHPAPHDSPPATQAVPDARLNAAAEPVRSQPEPAPAGALPLGLDEAVARGLRDGQEVQLARTQIEIAETAITMARAEALPQINGAAGYTRTFSSAFDSSQGFAIPDSLRFLPDPSGSVADRLTYLEQNAANAGLEGIAGLFGNLPFGQQNAYTASVGVSQLLYSGGQVGAGLRIADHARQAARLTLAEDAADVRRDVRTAYFQALLAEELAAIAEEGLAQADRVFEYERVRREAGQIADLDVMRAEVSRDNLRPQLVAARNALQLALLDLKRLTNIPFEQPIVLTTPLASPTAAALAGDRLDADVLLGQRAALQAAERQVSIRGEQVQVTRGSYLPRVTLDMQYGKQLFPDKIFDLSADWRTDWTAGVTVRVPIFTGFRRRAEIARARIEQERAALQLTQLKQVVQLDYEQAVGEKDRARVAIATRQRTAEVSRHAYDLTVLVYQQGLTTQLQVSDARLQWLQARSNLAQSIADFHIADAATNRAQTTADLTGLPDVSTTPGFPVTTPGDRP